MSGVIVLQFWSPTCTPCMAIKPSLEMVKEEFDGKIQEWVSINTKDDPKQVAARMQVTVVPTVIVLKNNQEVGRYSGSNVIMYYTLIRKALAA